MSTLMEDADRLAEATAGADDDEGGEQQTETPAAEQQLVPVTLNGETVQLDPETAAIIKRQFDTLHGRYGAELDQLRAQAFSRMGAAAPAPTPPAKLEPPAFTLPDPDLMFQNRKAWEAEFARQLANREAALRQENEALVHAAVSVIQEDLNAREVRQTSQNYEAQLFNGLMEKHESLRGHDAFVWATLDENYDNLRHLPAHIAYDRLGEIAEARLNEIRVNGNGHEHPDRSADLRAADAAARRSPTPRVLSSAASRGGQAAAPPTRASISDRILARQERFLEGTRAKS